MKKYYISIVVFLLGITANADCVHPNSATENNLCRNSIMASQIVLKSTQQLEPVYDGIQFNVDCVNTNSATEKYLCSQSIQAQQLNSKANQELQMFLQRLQQR